MWDLTVEQQSTWNGSALSHLCTDCPAKFQAISQKIHRTTMHHALHHSCLVSKSTIFYYYNAHVSLPHLRLHSPLKTVFGKLGELTKPIATHIKHSLWLPTIEAQDNPFDRDIDVAGEAHETKDTDIENTPDFHPVDTDNFENLQHNNPAKLTILTREVDDLHQWVQAGEGQPTETLNYIEHKLQRLSISLHPSAPTEPLGEVIRHYTNTLCSVQKQTNLTNSLLQDISVFNGHDATQLEDWLVDIEIATDLTAESRTKLTQAKSKGLTCPLITEAITSGKSWDNIKDLLWLKFVTLTFIFPYFTLWRYSKKKKNPLQCTYTVLKERLNDAILQITPPL